MVGEYSPLDVTGAVNYANAVVPDIIGQAMKERQLAMQQVELGHRQQEFGAKQQKLAEYQSDLAALNRVPPAERAAAVAAFMRKWPEFAQEMSSAEDIVTKAANKRDIHYGGEVISAIKKKNYPLAAQKVRERIEADIKAGKEVSELDKDILEALESGDEARIAEAEQAANTIMYGALGDKEYVERIAGKEPTAFQSNVEYVEQKYGPETARDYVVNPQIGYVDGQPVAIPAGALPRYGGGAPAPAPAAPGPLTTSNGTPFQPGRDNATGLKTLTSDKWKPGTIVYVAVTKQDFEKVPPGALFTDRNGDMHRKPN